MRNKLIKLLRSLEKEGSFKNEYTELSEEYGCYYSIEEHLDFPNYRLVIREYSDKYPNKTVFGFGRSLSENGIKSELKRMEADRLVMIEDQEAWKYATTNGIGPNFDDGEGIKFKTEGIVLTTKGKSEIRYFWHKATENPVTTLLSIVAVIISVIALFKK